MPAWHEPNTHHPQPLLQAPPQVEGNSLYYGMFKCRNVVIINSLLISELNDKGDWTQLAYVEQFDSFTTVADNVERIHIKDFPPNEFIEKYESQYKPVVICGIQENWKAKHKWTLEVSFVILYRVSIKSQYIFGK